jgi:hypothetical protein
MAALEFFQDFAAFSDRVTRVSDNARNKARAKKSTSRRENENQ